MRYTIFQVDASRQSIVDAMAPKLKTWDFVPVECVDGRGREFDDPRISEGLLTGHVGVWYTMLNAIEHAPLITIEDDAVLVDDFTQLAERQIAELPMTADFLAFFSNRDYMYGLRHEIGCAHICKAYQPNGAVAMYYTKKGRNRIRQLVKRDGFMMQFDNQLYTYAWRGELNGFSSKPQHKLVSIDETVPSIAQTTERAICRVQ